MTTSPLLQTGTTITDAETGAVIIRFDTNLEEKYVRDADVTAFPVQDGAPVTDNHQARQRMLDLVAAVSNTPLAQELNVPNRARRAFDIVDALVDSGRRVTVTSGYRVYSPALIKSYTVGRNYQTGQTMIASLRIVEIRTVESSTSDVPDSILAQVLKASGKKKDAKSTAPQQPKPEEEAQVRSSLLYSLFN